MAAAAPQQNEVPTQIMYDEMIDAGRYKKFEIDREDFLPNYREVIAWLRSNCCNQEIKFDGIPSLYDSSGLVQIEVVDVNKDKVEKSAKFVIRRDNLYLIAFTATNADGSSKAWFHYHGGISINGSSELEFHDGSYMKFDNHEFPWINIGLEEGVIGPLATLCSETAVPEHLKAMASQSFFFYLCEAARFRLVELIICNKIFFNELVFGMVKNNKEQRNKRYVPANEDLYSMLLVQIEEPGPDFINRLVHNYSNLSQIWYTRFLTYDKMRRLKMHQMMGYARFLLPELKMGSVQSLRFTLAVLNRPNRIKISELFGKEKGNPIDEATFESMIWDLAESQRGN